MCVERRDFEERRVGELDGSGGEDGKGGSFGESAVRLVAGLRRHRPCVTAQPHFVSRSGCGEYKGMMSGPEGGPRILIDKMGKINFEDFLLETGLMGF